MTVPVLPKSAPFRAEQRAWLNGFIAGVFSLDSTILGGAVAQPAAPATAPIAAPLTPEPQQDFPWHDPVLPLDERMALAEGRPFELRLMATTAQLDCGTCGYDCRNYAKAIADGTESSLTKCTPGGKETSKKIKELMAQRAA